MQALKAGAVYFGLVFAAGFVLGTIRIPLFVPRLGERSAELLEMPLMLVVVIVAARFVVRRFALARLASVRLRTGGIALALLLAAEALLAVALQSRSAAEYVASRDPVSGTAYLFMLVIYALMPAILLRYERSEPRPDRGER
jgi:hypothetical protein